MSKEKFEDALMRLEEIVKKLEGDDLSLEDALKSFEEGIRLARLCNKKLDEAQRRVEILLREDGETIPSPYKEGDFGS